MVGVSSHLVKMNKLCMSINDYYRIREYLWTSWYYRGKTKSARQVQHDRAVSGGVEQHVSLKTNGSEFSHLQSAFLTRYVVYACIDAKTRLQGLQLQLKRVTPPQTNCPSPLYGVINLGRSNEVNNTLDRRSVVEKKKQKINRLQSDFWARFLHP